MGAYVWRRKDNASSQQGGAAPAQTSNLNPNASPFKGGAKTTLVPPGMSAPMQQPQHSGTLPQQAQPGVNTQAALRHKRKPPPLLQQQLQQRQEPGDQQGQQEHNLLHLGQNKKPRFSYVGGASSGSGAQPAPVAQQIGLQCSQNSQASHQPPLATHPGQPPPAPASHPLPARPQAPGRPRPLMQQQQQQQQRPPGAPATPSVTAPSRGQGSGRPAAQASAAQGHPSAHKSPHTQWSAPPTGQCAPSPQHEPSKPQGNKPAGDAAAALAAKQAELEALRRQLHQREKLLAQQKEQQAAKQAAKEAAKLQQQAEVQRRKAQLEKGFRSMAHASSSGASSQSAVPGAAAASRFTAPVADELELERILDCKSDLECLKLTPGASLDQIRRSFKIMAMAIHPDKCSLPEAAEAFQRLSAAYNRLSKQ